MKIIKKIVIVVIIVIIIILLGVIFLHQAYKNNTSYGTISVISEYNVIIEETKEVDN